MDNYDDVRMSKSVPIIIATGDAVGLVTSLLRTFHPDFNYELRLWKCALLAYFVFLRHVFNGHFSTTFFVLQLIC